MVIVNIFLKIVVDVPKIPFKHHIWETVTHCYSYSLAWLLNFCNREFKICIIKKNKDKSKFYIVFLIKIKSI